MAGINLGWRDGIVGVTPAARKWAPLALGLMIVVIILAIVMLRGEWSSSEPAVKCSLPGLSSSGEVNAKYLGPSGFKTLKVNLSEWSKISRELERLGYKGECVIAVGLTTCPYCKSLERFLAQNYGSVAMWLYTDKSIELRDIASKIVILELEWGVPTNEALLVPNVIVLDKNGTPKYVIIGAYLDKNLWDSLLYG